MVVANIHGDKVLRDGAKVRIISIPGLPDSILCNGISKGGRRCEKWVKTKRLSNPRISGVPFEERDACGEKSDCESKLGRLERILVMYNEKTLLDD